MNVLKHDKKNETINEHQPTTQSHMQKQKKNSVHYISISIFILIFLSFSLPYLSSINDDFITIVFHCACFYSFTFFIKKKKKKQFCCMDT